MEASLATRKKLLSWYETHKRDLPWRGEKDPYRIWVSETMLQQTVSQTVKPYYKKFLKKFPTVNKLASAPQKEVLGIWSGLGYYSRAERLHKTANLISKLKSFPERYEDLIKLPGFGPYTSRAVASLGFNESVGVVDGNVIRVFSRFFNFQEPSWTSHGKLKLQETSDSWVKGFSSSVMNQALMELGATLCTPKNPSCFHCPLRKNCQGFLNSTHLDLPLKPEKKAFEYWIFSPYLAIRNQKIAMLKNNKAPFLKNKWLLPAEVKQVSKKPQDFDFQHSVTHYKIFVKQKKSKLPASYLKKVSWVCLSEVKKISPTSLVHKTLLLHKNSF